MILGSQRLIMKRFTLYLTFLLSILLLAAWACRREPGSDAASGMAKRAARKDRPNILIVTIDTIRADHVGCYGYFRNTTPVLDALAEESILFERCIAPVAQTLPSHTSLFTGVYPREHGYTSNLSFIDGVFTPSPRLKVFAAAVGELGYATAAFISAEPLKKEGNLDVGFQTWWEPEDTNRVIAERTNVEVFKWIESGLKTPFLLWVHYFDPHNGYNPPPPYNTMFQTDEKLNGYIAERQIMEQKRKKGRPNEDWQARPQINSYDGEIAYADAKLGEVFKRLRDKGVWDRTVVVVVGDHGEGLGQHRELCHNGIWTEQLHVPLIMRVPGRTPQRVSTPLSIVDILPTMLGQMDKAVAGSFLEQCTGVDVLAENYQPRSLHAQLPRTRRAGGIAADALLVDGWKFVKSPETISRHLREETALYHLESDPHELNNVIGEHPEKAAELERQLAAIVAEQIERSKRNKAGIIKIISAEKKEKIDRALKDLGYVEEDEEYLEDDE